MSSQAESGPRPKSASPLPGTKGSREPYSETLARLAGQVASSAHGRLELAAFELGDERARLGQLLTRGVCAAFLIFLSVQSLFMLAIAVSWDTSWRIPVMVGIATASLVATLATVVAYRRTSKSTLFDATADVLARDLHAVRPTP